LVQAIPIGGLRIVDRGEADDKIIAVLEGDAVYGGYADVSECPEPVIDRLKHYFLTYKQVPESSADQPVAIHGSYGAGDAHEVIRRAQQDYTIRYAAVQTLLASAAGR